MKKEVMRSLGKVISAAMAIVMLSGLAPGNTLRSAEAAERAAAPKEGLIAEYSFVQRPEDGQTVANKVTGTVGDAIVKNPSTAKWEDSALVFSGEGASVNNPVGTWVELPQNLLSGKSSATISIEVKPSASIITKNHFLWNIGNSGTDTYWFMNTMVPRTSIKYGGSEKTAEGSKLTADRWYNLTAVMDGEAHTLTIYVDGRKAGEINASDMSLLQVADQTRNTIGLAPYNDPLFQGSVASFRVYDRALMADEVRQVSDADGMLHEEYFKEQIKEEIKKITDITISDSRTKLPNYNGTVTWKSESDLIQIEEDGVSVFVDQPANGEEALTGKLTATMNFRGQTATAAVNAVILPEVSGDTPYGYMLVHFIEDSEGYAEKIYLDISLGDNPEYWEPLNGGEPILASHMGTTGVRDPFLTYNPETKTYYILATDLRVFGGDNRGWSNWQRKYSTKMNVWESKDLITWSDLRQFDVALDTEGKKQAELGMMWAPEATWVPDYYGEGKGAFVVYWSSRVYPDGDTEQADYGAYRKVMWGATTDFTQETYEYGGPFLDIGHNQIDTTLVQNNGKTYHVTKDEKNASIYMQSTTAKEWWKPGTEWTTIQTKIGAQYFGGVEGPAVFKDHSQENKWYLFVDDMPVPGYQPMISNDLDKGWEKLDASGYYLTENTKHGGVISLTKAQYDAVREADAGSAVTDDLGTVTVKTGAKEADIQQALPAAAEVNMYYNYGVSKRPVKWDVSNVDPNKAGEYEVTGTLETIGANLNQWVGKDGSTAWTAENKKLYSSTEVTVTAKVIISDDAEPEPEPKPIDEIFEDVAKGEWYIPYAQYVFDKGIMKGLDKTHFGPDVRLSRAQFATILYRMEGEPEAEYSPVFSDVPDEAFYTEAVMWASGEDVGVINGYENGTFGPSDLITREQMATMMLRYADYKEYDTRNRSDFAGFPDKDDVSEFATDGMSFAVAEGLITGDQNKLNPQGDTSRAVCATVIQRFMEAFQ